MHSGDPVDVIGVVTYLEGAQHIRKRNGDVVEIRRVTIKDSSNRSIEVHLSHSSASIRSHCLPFR